MNVANAIKPGNAAFSLHPSRKCYGLENKRDQSRERRKPITCARCAATNTANQRFCYRCGMALTIQAAMQADKERRQADDRLNRLVKDPEGLRDLLTVLAKHGIIEAPKN